MMLSPSTPGVAIDGLGMPSAAYKKLMTDLTASNPKAIKGCVAFNIVAARLHAVIDAGITANIWKTTPFLDSLTEQPTAPSFAGHGLGAKDITPPPITHHQLFTTGKVTSINLEP